MIERAFQIAESNVGVDRQTFDLMKHGRVAGVRRIVAMHFARNHDSTGGFIFSMVRICTGEV